MGKRKRLERMNDRLAGQAAKWQIAAISARRWAAVWKRAAKLERRERRDWFRVLTVTIINASDDCRKRNQRIAELEGLLSEFSRYNPETGTYLWTLRNRVWAAIGAPSQRERDRTSLAESQAARCDRLIEALRTGDTTCNVSTEDSVHERDIL
jgi:hypothetical protein